MKRIRDGTPSLVENLVVNTPMINKMADNKMNESVLNIGSCNKNSPLEIYV
jgi:hypothetical protein